MLSVVRAPGWAPSCGKKQRFPWANAGRPCVLKEDAKKHIYAGLVGKEMTSSTMLKAIDSTPPHPLAGKMVPPTIFDRATFDLFVPLVFVYPAPTPSNEALKEGLRRAVAAYPHMAGRLAMAEVLKEEHQHGSRRCIHVNNEGVLLLEAAAPVDLVVDGSIPANVDSLYPRLPPPEETIGSALLQVKLTRYRCGGLVMGLIGHHQLCDGAGLDAFLTTWCTAVREARDFTAAPLPFLDCEMFTVTAPSSRTPLFDHASTEFKPSSGGAVPTCNMKTVTVSFTAEFVAELKARVGTTCTTFQCVLAHIWKKTTQARGLKPEEFTQVRIAVNCRGRARPVVPSHYFGNMVLWAFPRLQARDVLGSTYGRVVSVIREAVARVDADYIQSFLDFGALADAGQELKATAPATGNMCCPHLEVDSWLGFGYHRLDFGGGPPAVFLIPDIPAEGVMAFAPSTMDKGGVDVFIALAEEHLMAFHEICYSVE